MVGVWCVWMWQQLGRPHGLRLIELGPGRGTLMADLLRSTAVFAGFARAVSVDLVEVRARLNRHHCDRRPLLRGSVPVHLALI
jgi:NADH dehydrogenase [ubiquinone] 1 alpha subcomplex assembly factor 7